ncbi:MAG TPA: SpoIIE family protein phosphatase [Blastocatellia bacterium]|nr:SpoIIE family protein phosphatase [Blastocatellia bacterium]
MAKLVIKQQGYEDTFKIDKPKTSIGRSSRNDVCIADPFASRLHAEIRREGDIYYLVDMGGVNGTFRNGLRVVGRCPLILGDRVRIGETDLQFLSDNEAPSEHTKVLVSDNLPQVTPEAIISSWQNSKLTSSLMSGPQPSLQSAAGYAPAKSQPHVNRDLLAVISRVGVALLSNASLDETLKQVMDLVFDTVPVERGFLLLHEGSSHDLHYKVAKTREGFMDPQAVPVQISRLVIDQVTKEGTSILTSDAAHDARFVGSQSIVLNNLRSVMAVPLAIDQQILGMIYVDSPFSVNRFTEDDLQVLTAMAGVAAIKIENARLMEERLEKKRLEEELAVASEIQLRLQPVSPPQLQGYELTGMSFPCREIGGDYYDFIERTDGNLEIALGDVSGKGTGAALLMASLHAAVRAQATTGSSVSGVMGAISEYLDRNSPDNKFATLFLGVLDTETGNLVYSNAGHNPPILIRADRVDRLEVGGVPVGLLPESTYEESTVKIEPNDILLLFSDGITESVNESDEEFGDARLIEVARQYRDAPVARLRDKIEEALSKFVGKAAPVDDMTLVIMKRTL